MDISPETGKKPVGTGKVGEPGNRNGGRPKGVPNKTTRTAREAIARAADELGGVDRLVAWVKESDENERAFWVQIYPKLLPLQVAGDPDNPLQTTVMVEFVRPITVS